ncbi:MAG TPA: histidinol-phosphate transaminase [Polyangiaceae bacterium]|nr:histidinol-phosphate transaminase [Polyangiaceae bacterium]
MSHLVSPSIESLLPYEGGKPVEELAREFGISDAIKLASNENPLGPSPKAVLAARAVLNDLHRYPDANAFKLRERLAAEHGVPMAEIIQGNGSNELLDLVVRTFCTSEHHIVFAEPSFVVYRIAALAHGVPFTAVPVRDLTHDLEAMLAAITPRTRLVFVGNPNNPTGTYVKLDAVRRFLRAVPPEVVVLMDEAYIEYTSAADFPDCLTLRGERERLIVCRTFSKIYGLAGLRVGYGISTAELVGYMNRVRAPFNVGNLGQVAAIAALDDVEHVRQSRELNLSERDRVAARLAAMGLTVTPSQANFYLVDVKQSGRAIYDALLRKGVIVRPFASLPNSLRVTVGKPAENDRFLNALSEVLS